MSDIKKYSIEYWHSLGMVAPCEVADSPIMPFVGALEICVKPTIHGKKYPVYYIDHEHTVIMCEATYSETWLRRKTRAGQIKWEHDKLQRCKVGKFVGKCACPNCGDTFCDTSFYVTRDGVELKHCYTVCKKCGHNEYS